MDRRYEVEPDYENRGNWHVVDWDAGGHSTGLSFARRELAERAMFDLEARQGNPENLAQ